MNHPTKKLILAALCFACALFLCADGLAQVVAGISANGRVMIHGDTINVCRGSTISYESVAQGSSLVSWKFNNGSPLTMTGTGPFSITYNNNGYDTTFQKVGSGAFADSMFIIVRVADEKPAVGYDFTPNNVCGNENIQFTNTTVNGAPFRYFWDFGDGSGSLDESPTHQFINAVGSGIQTFPVKLVVINANTCVDSVTKTVTILSVPDAAIGNGEPAVTVGTYRDTTSFRTCNDEASYNFKFTNESTTLSANTAYHINWGDGSPDSTFSSWPVTDTIQHVFPAGISRMTLSVTGASGCVGIKHYIVYVGVFPYGTMSNPSGRNEICETDSLTFSLTNTAGNSPGTSYIFYINDFTEGQFFEHPAPATIGQRFTRNSCSYVSDEGSQVFSNALGAYLLVQNPCGVNSSSIVPIYVSAKPRPNIYVSDTTTCVNSTISLINTSGFGNVITPTGGTEATCENKGKNVWTITPSTGFTIASGNVGLLNGNRYDQAFWTDGSDSLDIQFTVPGIYTARIYVGNERCGMDSTVTTICVRNPPQASFTMSRQNSCGPNTVDLVNTSTTNACDTVADKSLWTISYSDPAGCAVTGDPSYEYVNGTSDTSRSPSLSFTASGLYIINLQVSAAGSGAGCAVGIFTDTFYVKGPVVAAIAPLPSVCIDNGINPATTITSCYSNGPYGYQWSFTNGSPPSSTDSLPGVVSFTTPGDQAIQLILTDSSCMQSDTVNAVVAVQPLPATIIINDTTTCSGETISLGGDAVPGVVYQWSPAAGLSDPASSNPSVTLNYQGTANDTVYKYYLDISQGDHCTKRDSVLITVAKNPLLSISPASAQLCSGDSILLTATGAGSYTWDPAISLNNSTGSSVFAKPSVSTTYTVTGMANGCSMQQTVLVSVYEAAVADFTVDPLKVCTAQAVTVTNNSVNATGFEWTWGDGSGSTAASGQHLYTNAGKYDITLIARRTDASGFICADTMQQQVEVIDKIGAQINVASSSQCVPYTLNVDAVNAGNASLIEWVIYDSTTAPGEFYSTGLTASRIFTKPGSYSVRLIVYTATGCSDTAIYDFKVAGSPVTTFDPRQVSICGTDTTINFVAQTQTDGDETVNYQWFVNDNLEGTANPFTYHFQGASGSTVPTEFVVRLEAQNASGCGVTAITGNIVLNPIPDPSIQVSPALVQQQPNYEFTFREMSPANPNMIYNWNMGDRSSQTREGQQVVYQYGDTGTYHVKLQVRDFVTGCTATDSVTVSILHVPGYIQVPNAICPGCNNQSVRKFLPLAKGLKSYRLRIYTTWGQKIFETTSLDANGSPNVPWDGTINGKLLQQDAYSWQIEGIFQNGTEWKGMIYPGQNKPVKAGFITVIK